MSRPLGFYTDQDRRVRPITPARGVSRGSLARARRSTALSRPVQRRDTLQNPLLMANHRRWIKENVNPDSYDKVDWDSEIDSTLTPSESREDLQRKYPGAFVEKGPSVREIRELEREHRQREEEIDRLYAEYEASFEEPKRQKVVREIKVKMEKLPLERREKILREKPKLRREPLLRPIVIRTRSGRSYTRTRKIWRY